MKTRNFALILLAGLTLLVTSCVNEREIAVGQIGKDEIAFRLAKVQTKAATEDFFIAAPEKIASFRASTGETYAIEETVTSLDEAPVTKGTPAYTENVIDLYGSFSAIANPNDALKKLDDAEFAFNSSTEYWSHYYWGGVWDNAPFTFYMRMPLDPEGVTSAYTYDDEKQSIKFNYTSPETAALQEDILFASTTLEKEKDNGKNVTFYHALTGIKFANFYTNTGMEGKAVTKTIIKEVTLAGVKNTGTCEMIFDGVTSTTHSKDVAEWTGVSGDETFTLSCSDTTNYSGSNYGLDTLLNSTAKARNINDADGSLTFWVVPQEFEDSTVMISMTCDLELVDSVGTTTKTVTDTTITVSLGARNWQAGELHTFTLKPVIVGVELEDKMSTDKFTKSNVRVDNTGNVFEYVRINMIGNWVGEVQIDSGVFDPNEVILMGYTSADPNDTTEVEFWNDKDGKTDYGKFDFLTPKSPTVPASADSTINNWVRYDKYYYYTLPIGPNDAITDQLFGEYTVGPSPEFWIADKWGTRRKARNVHLVIDLMVQAIPAPVDENGNVLDNEDGEGYIRAWLEALDFAPTAANYSKLLDL